MKNEKILGVDYGEKKIGLAISGGEVAEPLEVVSRKYPTYAKASAVKQVASLCEREYVDKIVMGFSEGKTAEKTKRFGEELRQATGLTVEYWDETLTSQEAVKKMVQAGKKKSKRKLDEHAVAAALILQDYLDNH